MSVWFSCENKKIEKKKLGQDLSKFKKVMFQFCKVEIWVNPGQFFFFSSFQCSWQKIGIIKITAEWIRTADLRCRKQPLNQLSHNHYCKKIFKFSQHEF